MHAGYTQLEDMPHAVQTTPRQNIVQCNSNYRYVQPLMKEDIVLDLTKEKGTSES